MEAQRRSMRFSKYKIQKNNIRSRYLIQPHQVLAGYCIIIIYLFLYTTTNCSCYQKELTQLWSMMQPKGGNEAKEIAWRCAVTAAWLLQLFCFACILPFFIKKKCLYKLPVRFTLQDEFLLIMFLLPTSYTHTLVNIFMSGLPWKLVLNLAVIAKIWD